MTSYMARFMQVLGSRRFFWGVVVFFCLEALWIVFSAVYPMAFDEDFHFGLIKIYAEGWSPFLTVQPVGGDAFGAVARDPSYLYHYLMSFPYRLIAQVTTDQTVQVILLRIINVGLLAAGLVVFRKVLLRTKLSPAFAHAALAVFVLVPIVPFLGAHINYDNLLILLVAWMCLLAFQIIDGFQKRKVPLVALVSFLALCLFTSIVKYAFLPIFAAAFVFLLVIAIRQFRGQWHLFGREAVKAFGGMSTFKRVVLGVVLLLAVVLFFQRFGINTIKYGTPVPACDAVISEQQCASYGPWLRNHLMAQNKGEFDKSPLSYTVQWLYWLWHRMFFAVNGPASLHATRPPLPVPYYVGGALAIAGIIALLITWRRVFRGRAYLGFLLCIILVYCGVLWAEDYSQYLEVGWPVAVNGRYLLPLLLPMIVLLGYGFKYALQRLPQAKAGLVMVALLIFLQGGGVMTFILRSDASWNWPNETVVKTNHYARNVLSPVILEGQRFY